MERPGEMPGRFSFALQIAPKRAEKSFWRAACVKGISKVIRLRSEIILKYNRF
jgi:hypothetical protein